MQSALRVLFLGEYWFGSCARACGAALRRLGCNVLDLQAPLLAPDEERLFLRLMARATRPLNLRAYNEQVVRAARDFRPDFALTFKGPCLAPEAIVRMRELGVPTYNYYPDRMYFALGSLIERALPEYDCLFDTKTHWEAEAEARIKVRQKVYLPHGYDAELHKPVDLDERDIADYGCDVSVIAAYSASKGALLAEMLEAYPDVDLKIWGSGWHQAAPSVRRCYRGRAIFGDRYPRALRAGKISLGLLGINERSRDTTTTRTFEIPACGGFMIHERTEELKTFYTEDKEVVCYGSGAELADKVRYYLAHPAERSQIADAGHRRCVPAYSYDERVRVLLAWHREHSRRTT
jgi:spore maturation protein CgeB